MTNPPPLMLIDTWLLFAYLSAEGFIHAQKHAKNQLERAFGSIEVAQAFYNYQMELLNKLRLEKANH